MELILQILTIPYDSSIFGNKNNYIQLTFSMIMSYYHVQQTLANYWEKNHSTKINIRDGH